MHLIDYDKLINKKILIKNTSVITMYTFKLCGSNRDNLRRATFKIL